MLLENGAAKVLENEAALFKNECSVFKLEDGAALFKKGASLKMEPNISTNNDKLNKFLSSRE